MPQIKNLKKVAQRIKKALKNKEKIILYGDSDVDGICSTVILKETIENLGGEITAVYFPNREEEGYGLTKSGLSFLSKFSPALLFTLDCGIGNVKEAELAIKQGFKLIIIDHHVVLEKLPKAELIVDPKQKGDKYPFKEFAATGLVFKLAQLLLKEEILKESLLELCALATIADRMPQVDENERFIEKGIQNLETSLRPGLQALLKTDFVKEAFSDMELAFRINGLLNAGSPVDHLNETYQLLTAKSLKTASVLAEKLLKRRKINKRKIGDIIKQVEDRQIGKENLPFIFEGDSWSLFLLGTVASKTCQKYNKPAFLFRRGQERISGSVRLPEGFNGVEALKSCSNFLMTYGGHPLASGFSLKEENLEDFKHCLKEYFSK